MHLFKTLPILLLCAVANAQTPSPLVIDLGPAAAGAIQVPAIRGLGAPTQICSATINTGLVYGRLDAGASNASLYQCSKTANPGTYAWEPITGGGGGGGVSSVSGVPPIVSSGGSTPAISCAGCVADVDAVGTCAVPVNGNAASTTAAINACLAAHITSHIYFPTGTYNVDNSANGAGISSTTFSGQLDFAPGAIIKANTLATNSGDVFDLENGTNLVIKNVHITFPTTTPQSRTNAAGLGLHLKNQTNATIDGAQIDVASGTCITVETSVHINLSNINMANCSANGLFVKSSDYTTLTNFQANVTFDNAIELTNYTADPSHVGTFTGSNIIINNSTALGIAVPGASHVTITGFSVNGTCASGVGVFTDGSVSTSTPTDVHFSNGTVTGAGTYSNVISPCSPAGNGIDAEDAGTVSFDDIAITTSANYVVFSNNTTTLALSGIRGIGANIAGINLQNTGAAQVSDVILSDATGGFFATGIGSLIVNGFTAHNLNPTNGLHRVIDLEDNLWVAMNGINIEDTQAVPTGYIFLGITSSYNSPISDLQFNIPNGTGTTSVDSTFNVIVSTPGANTALSNLLSTTNINSTLLPQTGLSLGSTTHPWHDLFLYGSGTFGTNYTAIHPLQTTSQTWSIPDTAGANDTFMGTILAQTVFNKTFVAPALGTPVSGDLHLTSNITTSNIASGQGNGTKFQLSTGTTTTGHCVQYDATGNTIDSGAACGGAGTITGSGTTNTITKFTGSSAVGNSGLTDNGTTIATAENFTSTAVPTTTGVWGAYFGSAIGGFSSAIQTELNLSSHAFALLNSTAYANTLRVVNQQNGSNANAVPLSSHQSCSGTMNACNGIEGTLDVTGGTITAGTGSGEQVNVSAGVVASAYGFLHYPMTITGGTVTLGYGALLAAPAVSGGGTLTTYIPFEANGRPAGSDNSYLVDSSLITAPTARTGAGITNSYQNILEGSTFDTVVHNVDWGAITIPTTNAGASTWHLQSRVGAGSYTDRMTLTDASVLGGVSLDTAVTAVTQAVDNNSTKVATTAYVDRLKTHAIGFSMGDPGGIVLTAATTTTAYFTVPFTCTISAWNLNIDAGTITVKFWKVATGTAIPTSSNSINTSGVAISTGTAVHSTTLSDFTTTTVTANDIMAMNVTAVATAKYVSGTLQCDQ